MTGLWKVYAILLEYCCKLDYKMIITTLNIEKKEELEEIEQNFKNQLAYFEENQRNLETNLTELKEQIRSLQRQLYLEIQKKEEESFVNSKANIVLPSFIVLSLIFLN